MKKLVYSLLFLSFGSFAQLQPGYHPEQGYAYEDFGIASEYPNLKWSNLGTHAYTIDSMPRRPFPSSECIQKKSTYSFSLERFPTTKTGSLLVNQPYGSYKPVILDFGVNINGKKNVLDLSRGNAFVSIQLTNKSNKNVEIWFCLIDSTSQMINSVGTNKDSDMYKDFLLFYMAPNESVSKAFDFNTNAYEALYDNSECGAGTFLGKSTVFKHNIVSGVGIIVLNSEDNNMDAYKPFKLVNTEITISGLAVGSPVVVNSLDADKVARRALFYPNPATDKITFSDRMDNIVLMDMAGNIALQTESATELNLSTIAKGIYFLSSTSLTKPTKVIVK